MTAKKFLALLTFGAGLVGVTALGGLKDAVTRPNKGHGQWTMVASLVDGSFVVSEQGEATHSGKYLTHFDGQLDAEGNVAWAYGYIEAANGDRLFAEATPQGWSITGGTGRFDGATGSFTTVNSDVVVVVDPVAGTMTMTGKDTMEGTLTY